VVCQLWWLAGRHVGVFVRVFSQSAIDNSVHSGRMAHRTAASGPPFDSAHEHTQEKWAVERQKMLSRETVCGRTGNTCTLPILTHIQPHSPHVATIAQGLNPDSQEIGHINGVAQLAGYTFLAGSPSQKPLSEPRRVEKETSPRRGTKRI
jgi:hypothetical protein